MIALPPRSQLTDPPFPATTLFRSESERLSRELSVRFAQTPFCDGDFYGRSTKRFGGLLRHSAHAAALVQNTLVLEITQRVLSPWCDRIALNLTQEIGTASCRERVCQYV